MALLTPPPSVLRRDNANPFRFGNPTAQRSALPSYGAQPLQQPLQQTPSPLPPTADKQAATIFDKDHISQTLLGIGQAFLSNQNFGEGLGAAAGVMSKGQQTLRDDAKQTITYGGPNNQFEISADKQGNRTVREVPEFAKAAREERDAKLAPKPTDVYDRRSRALYAVSQLPPEQRSAAYADVLQNADAYGIDTRGMPPVWNDTYGQVAGGMGLNVNQALTNVRADRVADNRIETNVARTAQGSERIAISRAKDARVASKSSLPKAPPSTRKTIKLPSGFILN